MCGVEVRRSYAMPRNSIRTPCLLVDWFLHIHIAEHTGKLALVRSVPRILLPAEFAFPLVKGRVACRTCATIEPLNCRNTQYFMHEYIRNGGVYDTVMLLRMHGNEPERCRHEAVQRRHVKSTSVVPSLHALSERTARRHAYTTACGGKNRRRRCATAAHDRRTSSEWSHLTFENFKPVARRWIYIEKKQILIVHKSEFCLS